MPFGLQPMHLLVIAIIALLIFGPKRLPEIGRGIGRAWTEFRKGSRDMAESFREEVNKPLEESDRSMASPPPSSQQAPPAAAPAQAQADQPAMFCNKCGARNPADSTFCNKCGAKIGE
jgi:sec-independent protein translocase protein TatA